MHKANGMMGKAQVITFVHPCAESATFCVPCASMCATSPDFDQRCDGVRAVVEHDLRVVDVSLRSLSVPRRFRLQLRALVLTYLWHVAAQQIYRLV